MANTIQHGVNITANDVKDLVESGTDAAGRKTWQDLYGSSALSYQAQNDALLKSYGDIIAEAYKSSLQQQNALYDLGLSTNDTHDLRSIARQDMLAAYDSYLGQYQQAQQEIAEAYQTQKSTWDQALTDESTNFAKLYNYMAQYYTDVLRGATWTGQDLDTPHYKGEGKDAVQDGYETKTESLIDRYGLQWLTTTDEDGTVRQLTRDELMNKLFDADNNITELGREFYDMVFNMDLSDGYTDAEGNPITTFDAWLSDIDSDLYTWAHSPDTFNYTRQGTKLGTARSWVGLESDDGKFQAYQVADSLLKKAETTLKNINNILSNNEDILQAKDSYSKESNRLNTYLTQQNTPTASEITNSARYTKNAFDAYKNDVKESIEEFISDDYETFITALQSNIDDDIYDLYSDELESLLTDTLSKFDVTIDVPEIMNYKLGQLIRDEDKAVLQKFSTDIQSLYDSIGNIPKEFYRKLEEIAQKMYTEQEKRRSTSGR